MCSTLLTMREALGALPDSAALESAALSRRVIELRLLIERAQIAYLGDFAALRSRTRPTGSADPVAGVIEQTRLPGRVVRSEAGFAAELHNDGDRALETTTALLREGRLSVEQARTISRALTHLSSDDVRNIEPTLARLCADSPPAATDHLCRNARELASTQSPDARAARAHQTRTLRLSPAGDQVRIDGLLPAADGALLVTAIDALAAPSGEQDTRTHGQRQADGLIELARRQLTGGELPAVAGVRPHLHVTVDVGDLLDRTGTARLADRTTTRLGPAMTRKLACDPVLDVTVTRGIAAVRAPGLDSEESVPSALAHAAGAWAGPDVLTSLLRDLSPALGGSTHEVLLAGRTTRLVTPAQRRALWIRDRGCAHPGCERPPPWCEAHHLIHWADGGPTDLENLALVCGEHHHALHRNGDSLVRGPTGRYAVVRAGERGNQRAA